MGMLKRMIRQTTDRLLNKLGAQRNSHQLILNNSQLSMKHTIVSSQKDPRSNRQQQSSSRRRQKRNSKSNARDIPEALLMAAKNHLPPVQFHHVHGPNAILSKNKFVARRYQGFCQAIVFSNRVILPNERVYIKVLEIAKGWNGTIRFGFTSVDPATLRYQMPKHACPDMTNAGHTWAGTLAEEVVRRNSVIHFSYNSNGYIHFGINNQDVGVLQANVNTSQHLWFIVDIYGLTAAVELIDPRIHNASSELDLSNLGDEDDDQDEFDSVIRPNNGTMYKSTGAMDHLLYGTTSLSSLRSKKSKRSAARKAAARRQALLHEQWEPESLLMRAASMGNGQYNPISQSQAARAMLPNLNSIILTPAEQNIYSPMPNNRPAAAVLTAVNNRATAINESHDYYQIMTNPTTNLNDTQNSQSSRTSTTTRGNSSQMSNLSAVSQTSSGSSRATDLQEITQQMDGLQIRLSGSSNDQLKQSSSSAVAGAAAAAAVVNKSVAAKPTSEQPVAAMRRRQLQSNYAQPTRTDANQQQQHEQANKSSSHLTSPTSSSSAVKAVKQSSSISNPVKPKARQSLKKSPTVSRDKNNNSPGTKDCPICFDRPINCVLYQCGHMCTCYECGVKQWRTQSRTCPICRTVIKDVIKTYMS